MNNFIKFLKNYDIKYKENELLSKHTSFMIGGPCKVMVFPSDIEEVFELCYKMSIMDIPYYVIGNGTNLLVKDEGYDGVIIKLGGNFSSYKLEGNKITCQAGMGLFSLHKILIEKKLTGLEFSYGIPGTVGGATIMNAGAYENSVGKFIDKVYVLSDNVISIYEKDRLNFGYRFSNLNGIVLATKFCLSTGSNVKEKCRMYFHKRKLSQPYNEKSAGSIFKREKDFITSKQIDNLGLKGYNINGAEISTKHAGFIVNKGEAKFEDVMALIELVKKEIFDAYGIVLKLEVKIL